jgi:hypothetical protein
MSISIANANGKQATGNQCQQVSNYREDNKFHAILPALASL